MAILTRREAAAYGHTLYYTTKQCNRGHIDPKTNMPVARYVSTGACVECQAESTRGVRSALSIAQRTGMIELKLIVPIEHRQDVIDYAAMLTEHFEAQRAAKIAVKDADSTGFIKRIPLEEQEYMNATSNS